jgi:voltage-gated potassium channel
VSEGAKAPKVVARSPEDAVALDRFERIMSFPLILAAVLPLILVAGDARSRLAEVIGIVSWIVFVVDFVVHQRRLVHYLSSWRGRFDLFVVVVTAPWFLIVGPSSGQFVYVIRLARLSRVLMATRSARRLFATLGRVAIVAAGVMFISCAVAYYAEHPDNPGFATYGDALWWGIVTLTTVGYGDITPDTTAGRFCGVVIMITGIAVLGVLAGSLASFFRIQPDEKATPEPRDLAVEVAALREQVEKLTDQVARVNAS